MSSNLGPLGTATIDRQQFCRTCGRFATGVTIATVLDSEGTPHGVTINSFTSVSLDPPLILICLDHRARVLEHFRRSQYFAINILDEHQRHLSELFARRGHDRFDGLTWHAGETGVPLLPDTLGTVECGLAKIVTAGDHEILLGKVLYTRAREGRPLIYFGSAYRRLDSQE